MTQPTPGLPRELSNLMAGHYDSRCDGSICWCGAAAYREWRDKRFTPVQSAPTLLDEQGVMLLQEIIDDDALDSDFQWQVDLKKRIRAYLSVRSAEQPISDR